MTQQLFVFLGLFLAQAAANPIYSRAEVATEFLILHNNDMHARFEQTSVNSGKCAPQDANSDKCYGGFARVAHEVRKYRKEAKNGGMPVFYLNAGDTYTGTSWFSVFKDNITVAFMNKLHPDAISLGNHEFDDNVAGLVPLLNNVEFPVLACNLDLRKAPEIAEAKHFAHSAVLEVKGLKIGVIGYLTPDTQFLTVVSDVDFYPEIESINTEAAKLKAAGINIIIALGHSGYQKDQEIAKSCPDVDIVIGGHSHSFLYTGQQPDAESIKGPYPTVVKQPSGKNVPVVQAYAYTKYLGKLHVQFDKDGNLLEFDGTPILLNASIPRDDDVLELLEVYRPNITALENNIAGYTKVELVGRAEVCRTQECNLGNLLADSMIYARVLEGLGGVYWTDAAVAFVNGGGIRNSVEKRPDGRITDDDIVSVLPFANGLHVTKISGKTLRQALEHSASIRDEDSNGGFLQMSGVHVTYDFNQDENQRAVTIEVRCAECDVPIYQPLNDTLMYNVIVSAFLLNGIDNHVFVEENGPPPQRLQKNEVEAFKQYLEQMNFVYPEIEGRILIIEKSKEDSAAEISSSIAALISALIALRLFGF